MPEKTLSRILVDRGEIIIHPLGPGSSRRVVKLEELVPLGSPLMVSTRVYDGNLEGLVTEAWKKEGAKADAFIAHPSLDRYNDGSWIQFYNLKH